MCRVFYVISVEFPNIFFLIFQMEFVAGSNGQRLPAPYQDCLNQSLTSVVQSNSHYQGLAACQLELIFYILEDTS